MQVNTQELIERFAKVFPGASPRCVARAPGRVNLIGEHVDYNDGFVLPIAMSQALYVVAGPADDGHVTVNTTAFSESVRFPTNDPGPPGSPMWGNYVRGVARMLLNRNVRLKPARLLIHSDVPVGGGVSSSAALEVGTAMALLALAGQRLDPIPLALLARQAEHEYAHSPCGIMDQFICVLGKKDHALLLDCRSQEYEQLPLRFPETVLAVMNTQVKHEIGGSEYPVRQRQCQEGLAILKAGHPHITSLRDVTSEHLDTCEKRMDVVAFSRCRHVVTEIRRTQQAADALRLHDATQFGQLMTESHVSLRDDYAVSCPELDALVDLATGVPGCYGARMTGGGFGGCAIALIHRSAEQPLREAIAKEYDTRFKKPAIVYVTVPADGAFVHSL